MYITAICMVAVLLCYPELDNYICSGPFAGGILAMPLAGTYEMPTGGIDTWYAPRGHTRIADKDAKLL